MISKLGYRVRTFLDHMNRKEMALEPTPSSALVTTPQPSPVMATCHPNRPNKARGLCRICYDRAWRQRHRTEPIKGWPGLLDEVLEKAKGMNRIPQAARIPFIKVILRNHEKEVITVDQFLKEMPKILLPSDSIEKNRSNLLRSLKKLKIADLYRSQGKTYIRTRKSFADINAKRLPEHKPERVIEVTQEGTATVHQDQPEAIPHVVHVGLPKHIREQMTMVQEADHASKMALETGKLLQMLIEWDIKLERN